MLRRVLSLGAVSSLAAFLFAGEARVLFVSLDGLGYQNLTENVAGRELTTLHRLASRGVIAPLQTTFPSKTAAGHAALFTGAWSGVSGIFSNTNPRTPRSQYSLKETLTGFRSETLRAETLWTTAARQGISAVAYQATQLYPFTAESTGKATSWNGYQSWTIAPARVITGKDIDAEGRFRDGPLEFRIQRVGDGLRVSFGSGSVLVRAAPVETASPRGGRKLARYFSEPLWVEANGIRTGVYFRLFALTPTGFLLYRTPAQELAVSNPKPGFDLQQATGPFVPNSATSIYERGEFGPRLHEGGTGEAERRYLETFELVVRQISLQTAAINRELKPRLLVGYYPVIDDIEHAWFGFSGTGMQAIDAYRARAYAILDEGLKVILKGFQGRNDSVIFSSDHGMAANTHEVRMNVLLRELGFPQGVVFPNVSCLFVNTTDWKQGVVAPEDKPGLLRELRSKLEATGLFTRFYEAGELASRFGHGGDNAPDLCMDLKPLHYPVENSRGPAVAAFSHPRGEHGFDPTRPEMRSYVVAAGRNIRKRTSTCGDACGYRAVDLNPSICLLLGIQPAPTVAGKPLAEIRN